MLKNVVRPAFAVCCFVLSAAAIAQPIVIDGEFSSAEWSGASSYTFTANLPGGGTTAGEIYVTNDASNVYVCVRYQQSYILDGEGVAFIMDAKVDGVLGAHDNGIVQKTDDSCVQTKVFTDFYYFTGGACAPSALCSQPDPDDGGTRDGNSAVANDGTWTVHELWHPLAGGDSHDMSFGSGDKLGFMVNVRLWDTLGNFSDSFYPGPFLSTFEVYDIP
jgi:hypothetical protein